ncbi:MAG: cysteine desulfurase [Deltaproteobacteria bacterium]|nr:cysteine desulfurase [Deltaproteobacteria bacterium]
MSKPAPSPIYLDHNGTTPVDPAVLAAMQPLFEEAWGNPSSPSAPGLRAREALEAGRGRVARLLGCEPSEIVFTSGGSESNNTVLKGVVNPAEASRYHVITSSIEHPAVLNPALYLAELGAGLTVLPVDGQGLVDPGAVREAIEPRTVLVSVMLANNETGALQPVREISRIARERGVPVHTDAAQAVGKIPVDVGGLGVDFLSVAGHKLYAPKGVGALFVRKGRSLTPLIHGAAQERGLRAGTESAVLAAGLGEACRIAAERMDRDMKAVRAMRDRLQELLFESVDGLVLNGPQEGRLPNTLFVSVPGVEGGRILEGVPTLYASTGAACHDRSVTLSHVLSAMGVPPEVGMGALRLTVGRSNSMGQVEEAARMIADRVRELRKEER